MGLEELDIKDKKKETLNFISYVNPNSKWTIYLNIKWKTIKHKISRGKYGMKSLIFMT